MKRIKALRVVQPIGEFFIASIDSELLLDLTYSRAAGFQDDTMSGNQRALRDERVSEIKNFLNTQDAALPNSIILAANYYESDELEVDGDKRWYVEKLDSDFYEIVIPDENLRLCSIIDGQHRINGFKSSGIKMNLPCSVFFDLIPSMQAYIFSTINFNQQKVDKSLAYQLFGYQLDDSEYMRWSPDILAVKLSRYFNCNGPLKDRIILIKGADSTEKNHEWSISSAAFIEGIVSLISGNPKNDKYIVNKRKLTGLSSRKDLEHNKKYPLRKFYIDGNDKAIQTIVERYFIVMSDIFWKGKDFDNIIFRTVGFAAQFAFLKELLLNTIFDNYEEDTFRSKLRGFDEVDFKGDYFSARTATKKRIVDVLKVKSKLIELESLGLSGEDLESIRKAAKIPEAIETT